MEEWIQEYFKYYFTTDKSDLNLERANRIKATNLTGELFCYKPYNKYTLDMLKNNRIWCARMDTLNDPFECSFNCAFYDDEYKNLKEKLSYPNDVIKYLAFLEVNNKDSLFSYQERMQTYSFSFTRTYQSPNLWWHYANKYKGICVSYRIEDIKAYNDGKLWQALHPVMYSDKIVDLKPFIKLSPSKQNINVLYYPALIKHTCWESENEVRVVLKGDPTKDGKGKIINVPKPYAVYAFKEHMKKTEFTNLQKLLYKLDIPLFRLFAKDGEFGFERCLDESYKRYRIKTMNKKKETL